MESNPAMRSLHDTIDNVSPRPSSLLFLITAMAAGVALGVLIARPAKEQPGELSLLRSKIRALLDG